MAVSQYNGAPKQRVKGKAGGTTSSMDLKLLESDIVSNHKKNAMLTQFGAASAYSKVLATAKGKEPGDGHNKYEVKVVKRTEKIHR